MLIFHLNSCMMFFAFLYSYEVDPYFLFLIWIFLLFYSTARFKLHAREYILVSANTFSLSSHPMLASKGSMLASKGSMLSSKGNMLSCMILLAIEVDACMQLLARIRHRAVSRCTRECSHALLYS